MALPAALIFNMVTGLMSGPVNKVLDAYIKDTELRRKLAAEFEARLTDHMGKALELEQAVVLAEVGSEHWLTRSWRPLLMLTLLAMLVFFGIVLPMGDLVVGHSIQSPLAGLAAAVLGFPHGWRGWLHWRPLAGKGCRSGACAEGWKITHCHPKLTRWKPWCFQCGRSAGFGQLFIRRSARKSYSKPNTDGSFET